MNIGAGSVKEAHEDWVRDVAWSGNIGLNSDMIATVGEDQKVRIWKSEPLNQKQLNIGEKEYSNEFECGRSKKRKRSAKMPSDRPSSPPTNCFQRAVIITNSALQELTLEHADDATGLVLPACVHQVVGVVGRPRLSISLELRLPL